MGEQLKLVDESEMGRLRGQLQDLMVLEESLSDWELDFLDGEKGLTQWEGKFSVKQAAKLDEIYMSRC